MKKITIFIFALLLSFHYFYAQTTTVTKQNTLIKSNHNFGLTNPVYNQNSPMTYDPSQVSSKGAAFSINYTNQGGTSFDGYPSGTIGGYKAGGTYSPGNVNTCGMPVQIQDLTDNLRINWKTSQANANDSDDKWWATINVIFDSGTSTSEPDPDARDYDLVIQNVSYMQDDLTDFINPGGRYWYFAREGTPDPVTGIKPIKPFTLYINGVAYSWAVRYKFFDYPAGHPEVDKNDKVHIKFIPIDNSAPIPYLDHSLKQFIDCTKNYIAYVQLNPAELTLANQKVGESTLWIKSISAGYEIYEGASTLNNDYFYTTIDNTAPNALTNLTGIKQSGTAVLNWDASTDTAFDTYSIYRSDNGGAYNLIASDIRINNYTDNTVTTLSYNYYITAKDRSFNESNASNIVNLDFTPLTTTLTAIDDAYVRNGTYSDINYGTTQNIQVRETTSNSNTRNSYLKFNLTGISNIISAKLIVTNTGTNGDVNVSEVSNDNWSENTITWNTKPNINSTLGSYSFNNSGNFDLDVTNYIINELQGDKTASFALTGSTTNYMQISSKEGAVAPQLVILYKNDGSTAKQTIVSKQLINNENESFSTESDIVLYPNPTERTLNLQINNPDTNNGKIEVYDSLGRLTQKSAITSSQMSFDLNGTPGIYILKIENNESVITKRVIKQ
ncbi:DNRLRE domain-containing protein [Flavobacterium sp. NG2]|uniref:CBM96 family carbohydrate-binding protein n=1 Tax=Flavobacterium sp. NG2 TaxID=3097547 RepID=UPI002A81F35D|nr:DNRLRE domain-containing protein [Flavobacterium sp. NG2]WPR71965.1 DNRLRE domain-containing protein [Flavobacterium sp. NG2]